MRIRELRNERGISQKELGARVGLDQATVSRIERGERSITLEQAVTFAGALGVHAADLIPRDEPEVA